MKPGDRIRTKYGDWFIILDIWDNVITTTGGYVHVANVVEVKEG